MAGDDTASGSVRFRDRIRAWLRPGGRDRALLRAVIRSQDVASTDQAIGALFAYLADAEGVAVIEAPRPAYREGGAHGGA